MTKIQHARTVHHSAKKVKAKPKAQKLPMAPRPLTSPLDGTSPLGLGMSGLAGANGGRVPQVNATNQSALAPNGDINQSVTNNNNYENRYYNIISLPQSGYNAWGGWGMLGGLGAGQTYVDPMTGVMYARRQPGLLGWLKSLLRGY